MALFTITNRNIQAGAVDIDIPITITDTDRELEFLLTADNWPAGRNFVGGLYESFNAGASYSLALSGVWNGPQATDGSVVAGGTVSIPAGINRANYRVKVMGTVTGGTIRVGGSVESR